MTEITFLEGDATQPQGEGNKIIAHICNDIGGWGAGFVLAISRRWPEPESEYRAWHANRKENDFGLGAVQIVQATEQIWVANMVGQEGIRSTTKGPPIRYEAVEKGLFAIAKHAQELGATIHMPRIGCGLAGGKWDKIEPLIVKSLCEQNVQVFVYDFQ